MSKRLLARAAALTTGVALVAGGLVGLSSPAFAAPLGTVNLSQATGSVTDTPMFASGVNLSWTPSAAKAAAPVP